MNSRAWAYAGTMLGGVASLAANVAHSFIAPAGAPAGWRPEAGAVAFAAFWPVAVFVVVEILVRTPWPKQAVWTAAKFAGLLPVALVAAIVSYRHLSALFAHYGDDPVTVAVGPIAVDGLMVMAAAALLVHQAHQTLGDPAVHVQVATDPEPATEPEPDPEAGAGLEPAPIVPTITLPAPPRTNGHVVGTGVIGTGVVR